MAGTTKQISYQLAASAATGISTSASGTAAVSLLINGSLTTAGVATLDSGTAPAGSGQKIARRVIVTSAGDDSGITFTITGTDRYGRPQVEVLTGGKNTVNSGVAQSAHDFATVTSIVPSGNTASTVTAGTNGVGSSAPWITDTWANPGNYGLGVIDPSGAGYNIEGAYDDLSPSWDVNNNSPTWYTAFDGSAAGTANASPLYGPYTMLRLTITSGTGQVIANFIQPFIAGKAAA